MFTFLQDRPKQCDRRSDCSDPVRTEPSNEDQVSGDRTQQPDRAPEESETRTSESREVFKLFLRRTPTWMKTSARITSILGKRYQTK